MEAHDIFGFAGDFLTFAGAVLFGWDPLMRERVYLKRRVQEELPPDLTFEDEHGRPIAPISERVEVRGESKHAKIGYVLLVLGFSALLIARSIEVFHHPDKSNERPPCCADQQKGG